MTILVLNVGSTSVKFALYGDENDCPSLRGAASGLGTTATPSVKVSMAGRKVEPQPFSVGPNETPHAAALRAVLDLAAAHAGASPDVVAHRIVHGGLKHVEPCVLSDAVVGDLEALNPLAPLHQPYNLLGVRLSRERAPGALQVGAFDTAFHANHPRTTRLYALPRRFSEAGVLRYGFHGLSYSHVARTLRRLDPERSCGRVIAAHLGGGASLCAMRDGVSVAATMGFTALDGVPMGTRVGDLDPGAVLYMLQAMALTPSDVARILYEESGLLGVSGLSGDMQTLLASTLPEAKEAIDVFVYRIGRELGSLAAALGGVDALVFTGGIGENASGIRARVAAEAAWLGVALDPERNARAEERIDAGGPVTVLIVVADEEGEIVRAARDVHAQCT